jgi:hypothetical protein
MCSKQFAIMLDVLENYLLSRNHSYERIDGSVRGSERQVVFFGAFSYALVLLKYFFMDE